MSFKFFYKKIFILFSLFAISLGVWASDYVFIGTYTNDCDGKDYDIILEYEGEKFINLEINVLGDKNSQFCAWKIKGDKKIKSFYSSLKQLLVSYQDIESNYKDKEPKRALYEIDNKWPSFYIQGRHFGKSSDYEMENLIDRASVQAYYRISNGVRQLMILAQLIDDYGDIPKTVLMTTINFTSPESLQHFMTILDPAFLTERIQLKGKLMNERK